MSKDNNNKDNNNNNSFNAFFELPTFSKAKLFIELTKDFFPNLPVKNGIPAIRPCDMDSKIKMNCMMEFKRKFEGKKDEDIPDMDFNIFECEDCRTNWWREEFQWFTDENLYSTDENHQCFTDENEENDENKVNVVSKTEVLPNQISITEDGKYE